MLYNSIFASGFLYIWILFFAKIGWMSWLGCLTHIVIIRYHAADLLKNGLQIGWFGGINRQKRLHFGVRQGYSLPTCPPYFLWYNVFTSETAISETAISMQNDTSMELKRRVDGGWTTRRLDLCHAWEKPTVRELIAIGSGTIGRRFGNHWT